MLKWYLYAKNWLEREEGQDLIEYALIIVLIVLVVALALPAVANQISSVFSQIATTLQGT